MANDISLVVKAHKNSDKTEDADGRDRSRSIKSIENYPAEASVGSALPRCRKCLAKDEGRRWTGSHERETHRCDLKDDPRWNDARGCAPRKFGGQPAKKKRKKSYTTRMRAPRTKRIVMIIVGWTRAA